MAKTCCICNQKIGYFGNDPLELDEYIICCDCAGTVMDKLFNLYYCKNQESFSNIAKEILNYSNEYYTPEITDKLIKKIETIHSRSHNSFDEYAEKERAELEKRKALQAEFAKTVEMRREKFIVTTTNNIEGQKIIKYLGVVSGEASIGTGFFSELGANAADFFGGEASGYTSKLGMVKQVAIERMKEQALSIGATAVVGVDIDIMDTGRNMFLACANGTAVIVETQET